MNAINLQLTQGAELSLRKRASYAMGSFAIVLNTNQLNKLLQLLLTKLQSQQQKSDTIIQLQCLSIMAKSIGSKLAPHLANIIPMLDAKTRLGEQESVDEDNELAECALTTLEAIIRKCANEVTPYVQDLISNAMRLTEYDPNYEYQDDDEDEKMDEDDGEGWGDDDDDAWGGGDDDQDDDADDDTSWKVRRAAVGIIDVIVRTRPDKIKGIIMQYAD